MELQQNIDDVFQAAQEGDAARIKEILESHPSLANMENNEGLTPLGFAAHFGREEAVQVLLNHGADINALSHSRVSYIPSNTPLHAAIAGERSIDVIRLLLTHNAQTNILDSDGYTSLHSAAFHTDSVELIQLLIDHGADIYTKSEDGKSSLDIAIKQGNHKVTDFLFEKGVIQNEVYNRP